MSEENVELARRGREAFNARDFETLAEISDEELVFISVLSAVDTTEYRGKGTWVSYFAVMDQTWEDWRVEELEVRDAGDAVVGVFRLIGTGRTSGARVEQTIGIVYRMRDGRFWRMRSYLDPADAFADAGLEG